MRNLERWCTWLARIQFGAVVLFAVSLPLGKSPPEAALVIGLLALAARTVLRQRRLLPKTPLNVWLLAWGIVAACSMVNSVDLWASLNGLRKLAKYAGLYLLIIDTIQTRKQLQIILGGWCAGLTLLSLDGWWQQAFNRDLFYGRPPAYYFDVVKRVTATFQHPADFGIYLVSSCPIVVALALGGPRRWRAPLMALSVLSAALLVLARARGGFLAFIFTLPLLGLWLRHWMPPALAAVVGAAQALTTPSAVTAWAATMPSLAHWLTEPDRLMYWTVALNMIKDHPFIGVGVNTFVQAYPAYEQAFGRFQDMGPYAHNQYLHLAAECGLLGLLVLIGVLVSVFAALARQLRRRADGLAAAGTGSPAERVAADTSFERLAAAGLGAGLIAYLINGLLESSLFYSKAALMFWFLVALLIGTELLGRPPASGRPRENVPT